tara:strand:- start:409 stop:666 length:258 start_codon:yes stop_codon:yes gene_type:complete
LKSENVLVDDKCRIKMCDFGTAIAVKSEDETKSVITTYTGKVKDLIRKRTGVSISSSSPKNKIVSKLTQNICTKWYRAPELILLQ